MTFSLAKPVTSMTLRFHSMTQPALSTEMIGAMAVSTMYLNSAARRSASSFCLFNSVMSWPTPITPVTSPFCPWRVVAFSRISRRVPSLVNSGNAKFAVSLPSRAFFRTSPMSSRYSFLMKVSTNGFPSAISLLKPEISSVLRFHSMTRPCVSMPKMGALAVSMSLVKSSATRDRSTMVSRIFVKSWPHATMPAIPPLASRKGPPLIVSTSCLPSLVFRLTSNSPRRPCSRPAVIADIRLRITFLHLSPTTMSTRGLPTTSSLT
mmetsp:Transcript_94054/g.210819  ORF Transcript_94054/g.210819 Transcript_94054/m.210819 type:complete len:264 (-) Transcript_94054:212-1003(-)